LQQFQKSNQRFSIDQVNDCFDNLSLKRLDDHKDIKRNQTIQGEGLETDKVNDPNENLNDVLLEKDVRLDMENES